MATKYDDNIAKRSNPFDDNFAKHGSNPFARDGSNPFARDGSNPFESNRGFESDYPEGDRGEEGGQASTAVEGQRCVPTCRAQCQVNIKLFSLVNLNFTASLLALLVLLWFLVFHFFLVEFSLLRWH